MSADLPDSFDPWRTANSGLGFSGTLALRQLPRLAAVVIACDDPPGVSYRLSFGRDETGRAMVTGQVNACLRLRCQRCLEPVEIAVDASLQWGLVRTEQDAAQLPDELDPIVVTDDRIDPIALIEDELLLVLPVVPRHDEGCCRPPGLEAPSLLLGKDSAGSNTAVGSDTPHPFAILSGLKRHSD